MKCTAEKEMLTGRHCCFSHLATHGETLCSPENYAREHCRRIDLMLSECGFPLLNPHNPFDSLVISAIRSEDEEELYQRQNGSDDTSAI